jgi:hypothetical protein
MLHEKINWYFYTLILNTQILNMNNFQSKLHSQITELNRVAQILCNSDRIYRLDLDVLLEKLRASYDIALSFDDKDQIPATKTQPLMDEAKVAQKVTIIKEQPLQEQKPIISEQPKPQIQVQVEPNVQEKEIITNKPIVAEVKIEPKPIKAPKTLETQPKAEEILNQIEQVKKELSESQHAQTKEEPSVLQYLNKKMPKTAPVTDTQDQTQTSAQKTIADTYQTQKSIFENISSQKENDIASSFAEQNSMDLRSCIGVNEKFMFINDLFAGDLKEYNDFIQKLNSAFSLISATAIVDQMKKDKHWVANSLSFTTLQEIVSKKFR